MEDKTVRGRSREDEGAGYSGTGKNGDYFQIYLEELSAIPACTREEEEELFRAAQEGDASARNRLAEGNLRVAVKLAEEYRDRGLPVNDLVQEANMALLLFVEELRGAGNEDFHRQMEAQIRSAIEDALEAQGAERRIEEEMAARVNVLKDISLAMAGELGREATVEELAGRMKMTVEEIKDIMKLTLDAMSVDGSL